MKIALIARSTLHIAPGGDTIQVTQTARHLQTLGIEAVVKLTNDKIDYGSYDAFHFFNLIRPADILRHLRHIRQPIFITPILVDYSEYENHQRKGMAGRMMRLLSPGKQEYFKALARSFRGKDRFPGITYFFYGHHTAMRMALEKARALLPNSCLEQEAMEKKFNLKCQHHIVPNGIDPSIFRQEFYSHRTNKTGQNKNVLCVARIEGIKNQLNLIRALNNTEFNLTLIGKAAPNHHDYYNECRRIAGNNIRFIDHLPQEELVKHYLEADIHILPSWFETCGLSSLEAAAMGCRIVVSDRGYVREYFGPDAMYCQPGDPASILESVRKASLHFTPPTLNNALHKRIYDNYTWPLAARITLSAYQKFLQ